MPPSEQSRIFISYAHRDGAELAARLQKDLNSRGFDAWLDKQRLRGGAVWTEEIEREIDKRQVTVAILSTGSYESEICRAEQLRTLRKGKRLIPVLAIPGADRPIILEARQYRDFTDPASYDTSFVELVADILGDITAALPETYRATRVTYITAPPRVANYIERPDVLRALRDSLFAEDHHQPIALTALYGMGGIGKTVLAKALTEDVVVQQAFPDGIVWVTAGREARRDFIEQMREVAKALGEDLSRFENAQACEHQYRSTIANKAALIVVDDVWSKADIEPLLAESPRSRFLFTTRDTSIGRFVGASEHSLDLLDQEQSRQLLAAWAGLLVTQLPVEADEVIGECGSLPLALSVVGAMLRNAVPKSWADTLDLLRKVDLSAIQEQLPDGQQSFFKSVEVSFHALAPQMQERYRVLALLPEDMAAPLPILEILWNVGEPEARRISRHFVDRSLAQRDGASESIRLHDLQLDYVRAQHPDKDALALIHGAVRLSANVIGRDPSQFSSQLVGRLLPHQDVPTIKSLIVGLVENARAPWLQPLHPALQPSGASLIRTLEGHSGWVLGVTVSGEGRLAVSASADQSLKVWDMESGRELRTLQGHSNYVSGVGVTPDGKRAVSASWDQTLKVWDVESGLELHTLKGHSDYVSGVAVTPDGKRAVSASWDQTLKVWDVESGLELHTLKGHSAYVSGVSVAPDGKRAISTSGDKTLKVWDVNSGRELRTLQGHSRSVNGVAVAGDGQMAVSASSDLTLKVWDLNSGHELRTLEGHTGSVEGVAMSGNGRLVVSASDDNTLKVWDMQSGRELRALVGHSDWVRGVAVSDDGQLAVSASDDNTLKVWDVESGRELRTLHGHSDLVRGVAVSGDGRLAVSASDDKTLKVWDVESGRELRALQGHSDVVRGVALSEDGRLVISASDDKTLKVWGVEKGRELRTLQGHSDVVRGVAVSKDGRLAVSASDDQTLKVWEVGTGRELRALVGHSDRVRGVAVSGDGRLAVSVSADQTVKVWDVESGKLVASFTCDAGVYCCAFHDGRKLILAGDAFGQVHFLRLEEPKAIG